MTFNIEYVDKSKLHKMCSEAMAFLSCAYDFGAEAIKIDVLLKSVNHFVTRNLSFFSKVISLDLIAKENAFCLSIAERESLKYFSYKSEEEAQTYHYAFWVAVNVLMMKEHGSLMFFNKTFKEAMTNCLPLIRANSTSKVLSEWLGYYTAGQVKSSDLVNELATIIDVWLNITTGKDNESFVGYVKDSINAKSFEVDQAFKFIESSNPSFNLIFKLLPERQKCDPNVNVEGKLAELSLYQPIRVDQINLNRPELGKHNPNVSSDKPQTFSQYDQDISKKNSQTSSCLEHNECSLNIEKENKLPGLDEDVKNSSIWVKWLFWVVVIVLLAAFAIIAKNYNSKKVNPISVDTLQSTTNGSIQFSEEKYLKAQQCIAKSIQVNAHQLKYLTFIQKDFHSKLEMDYSDRCSMVNQNDPEYKKALNDFDEDKRSHLIVSAISDMDNVNALFNNFYTCCFAERSDLISVFLKLNKIGYDIPADDEIRKNTISAIKKFQQDVGIPITGEFSDSLVSAIDAELMIRNISPDKNQQGSKDFEYSWGLEDYSHPTFLHEYNIDAYDIIAAANGDLEIMLNIGNKLLSANNNKLAFEWIKTSAEKGNPDAQLKLSEVYENGIGCSINIEKSIYWLKKASDSGNVNATLKLADIYLSDVDDKVKQKDAYERLSKACYAGYPSACGQKGYLLIKGIGTSKDVEKGMKLLKDNALSGDPVSEFYCYELIHESGDSEYLTLANNLLGSSANKKFGPAIFIIFTDILKSSKYSKEDKAKSIVVLRRLADDGNTDAQVFMGRYLIFNATSKEEINSAKTYLYKAMLKGQTEAMLALADFYQSRGGNSQRKSMSKPLYELACQKGNKEACIEVQRLKGEQVLFD